ncbi:MAG: LD-carboxypeptidase [Deltaproteobacteria bacterium]|nr:LD-carboxypeptidase [Deltaproteobacteria bacterium]
MLQLRRPPALRPGARIGIAAPSGPFDAATFERGVAVLRRAGFDVVLPAGFDRRAAGRLAYLAGDDDHRAATLTALFADADVNAIWCARGGYGAARILRRLDPHLVRANPKLLVGFSDITAIQTHLFATAGVPSIHGPNVTTLASTPDDELAALWRLLAGNAIGRVLAPNLSAIRRGRAAGPAVGGNLSVLASLVGTAYFPPVDGAILFLEDVSERPYRVDRMLTQLTLANVFVRVAGVVLGEFVECIDPPEKPLTDVADVLADCLSGLSCPVVARFPFGHGGAHFPIPLGTRADIDADALTVNFPEAVCG